MRESPCQKALLQPETTNLPLEQARSDPDAAESLFAKGGLMACPCEISPQRPVGANAVQRVWF